MESKKKYEWGPEKPLPKLEEHSQAKHTLISDYLRQYINVYMSNVRIPKLSLTIVDGFSGGGRYLDEITENIVPGSPLRILQAVKEAEVLINTNREKPRFVDAEYYFIDEKKPHIEFLKQELSQPDFAHAFPKIKLLCGRFETVAPEIISSLVKKKNRRAIFILDQYGYKDVPFRLVNKILSKTNSEVILTFNYDRLQAYLSDTKHFRKSMANIQLEKHLDWGRFLAFKEAGKWQGAIQEQLAYAIHKASGARHMTLFFIDNKNGAAYWLVHLSNLYKARDVMMELHWKHANTSLDFSHYLTPGLFSLGYKSYKMPLQSALDIEPEFKFGEESKKLCIQALSKDLPSFLKENGCLTFQNIVDGFGSYTPASSHEFKAALQPAIDSKELEIVSPDGTIRRSSSQVKLDDTIQYRQHQIIVP